MKSLTRVFVSGILASLLLCPIATSAQWNKKPYTEWSEKEAQRLLEESPWAKTQVYTTPSAMFRATPNQQPVNVTTTGPPNALNVNFRVRFLSALPVRMAVKRVMEEKQKEGMSEQLAAQLESFVTSGFEQYIVITVTVDSDQPGANFSAALGLLQTTSTAGIKNDTFLQVGKQRVFLEEYQTPRSDSLGARFIFPRLVDGKPFITPDAKDVRFVARLSNDYKLDRRYKIKDMMFEGKLEY